MEIREKGKKSREKNNKGRKGGKGRKTMEKVKNKRGKGSEIAVKLSKKRKLYKYGMERISSSKEHLKSLNLLDQTPFQKIF